MQLDFERARNEMVANQLQARGLRAPNVLEAMRSVPREIFLPPSLQNLAYEDAAIPILSPSWPRRCRSTPMPRFLR